MDSDFTYQSAAVAATQVKTVSRVRESNGANNEYCKLRTRNRPAVRPPQALLLLGAPSNHAGRNPILIRRANRHGCRFSRAGPGMALRGGPPNQYRITGMPSDSEGPSGGARALWLLSRSSKVTRCKSGTISGRYRSNGYVHHQITVSIHSPHRGVRLEHAAASN